MRQQSHSQLLERLDELDQLIEGLPAIYEKLRGTSLAYREKVWNDRPILAGMDQSKGTELESGTHALQELVTQIAKTRGEILRLARTQGATYREITERTGLGRTTVIGLIQRIHGLERTSRRDDYASWRYGDT